jgi:hypothetical protein
LPQNLDEKKGKTEGSTDCTNKADMLEEERKQLGLFNPGFCINIGMLIA